MACLQVPVPGDNPEKFRHAFIWENLVSKTVEANVVFTFAHIRLLSIYTNTCFFFQKSLGKLKSNVMNFCNLTFM